MDMLIIYGILIFIVNYIFTRDTELVAESYYQTRVDNGKTTPKVYDILHSYLPDFSNHSVDYHHIISMSLLIPMIFMKWEIIREYIGYFLILVLIRAITIRLTILPKNKNCIGMNPILGACYDKIYSGHFTSVFLATILYYKYNYISMYSLVLINIINAAGILLYRWHYTIDIIVSMFVTLFIYQNKITL